MSMEPQDGGDEFSETEEGPRGAPRPGWTSSAPCNETPKFSFVAASSSSVFCYSGSKYP